MVFFFSDLGSGDKKIKKKALKMTSFTGHFQRFFNISRKNSKTIKVNQQSVLNL